MHPIRSTMRSIDREDKALQRCTLSARSMPGDGQEHLAAACAPAFPSIFWPQSEKPPELGRSPNPGQRKGLPLRGRTYVHIPHPWVYLRSMVPEVSGPLVTP